MNERKLIKNQQRMLNDSFLIHYRPNLLRL